MAEPEPQLLSLLEKVANPLQQLSLKLVVHGVYAPPEQWKTSDEANPNIFGYALRVLGQEYTAGKIEPRKLTEKQLKQLEEKSKKGGKKQSKDPKEEEKKEEVDPAEQQRKQRQWEALSEEEKFYATQEDPFKAFSLKFPQKEKQSEYDSQAISILEQQIERDNLEIVLIRRPQISQQEIQKLKKAKSKTLNVGELYPAAYRGSIRAKLLEKPGQVFLSQRVKLRFDGVAPDDAVKIQTDSCYVYVQLQLSEPITPEVKQIKPQTAQVLPDFPNKSKQAVSPIQILKAELCRSIRAISQQYITCFAKEKDHPDDKRHSNLNTISTLRLNQINKRKQVFLSEFVSSGKFSLLKQRLSRTIKSVVIDKFRKEKQGRIITKQEINATLSELSLYFQQQFMKTVDDFMANDSTAIHEDLVLGYEHSRQARKTAISQVVSETEVQRELRLAAEYDTLQKQYGETAEYKAEDHYINVLLLSKNSIEAKENYAKFCLKAHKFNEAYALYSQISEESGSLEHRFITAVLLVHRRRVEQTLAQVDSMMGDPACEVHNKINYNLLLSFMYERQGDTKNSEKYLAIAERYYKVKKNPYLKFTPQENPYELPKPAVPKPARYASQLTAAQSQQIRQAFVGVLAQLNLYDLVSEYLPKLEQGMRKSILCIQVDVWGGQYEGALAKIEDLLAREDNSRNMDLLMVKADICYQADRMFECEQIFLQILQLKPPAARTSQALLRLGYTYLHRKSWQDAKQVFQRAVEQKHNCSVAWLGLGIADLHLGNHDQAEEALNLCHIYDPLSAATREYQQMVDQAQRQKYSLDATASEHE